MDQGEIEVAVNYRQFKADKQYRNGSGLNPSVTALHTQVISKMKFMEMGVTYAYNQQLNFTLGLPYLLDASSNRALPATVAGSTRFEHSATGIGDMTLGARYWLMDCQENTDQNFGIGVAVKTPTGDSKVTDLFPNAAGLDIRTRVVDQSIQPGDDGWGFLMSFEGFKTIGDFTLFASGAYLFNPKGQNDTFSPPAFLNPVGPQNVAQTIRYNTVSDSYILRAGVGYPLKFLPGVSLSLAGKVEGVPQEDVFGDTTGFRRPGYFVTAEPGIIYNIGRAVFALSVPLRLTQYVDDSLGAARDSTFADHLIVLSASYRFEGFSGN